MKMISNLNGIILLIIAFEEALLCFLNKNYLIGLMAIGIFLFSYFIIELSLKKNKSLPKYLYGIFVFFVHIYILSFVTKNVLIVSILSYHWMVWASIVCQPHNNLAQPIKRKSIDVGVNQFTLFFLSVFISIYFSFESREYFPYPILSEIIAFFLLSLNFLMILVSHTKIRFRSFQNFYRLVFSPTFFALLILFISGSYVVSAVVPNPILIKNQNSIKLESKSFPKKKKAKVDSEMVGYSNDLSLSKRSDLRKEHLPEIFLKIKDDLKGDTLSTGKIYLKGSSFDTYTGTRWGNYYDNRQWLEDGVNNIADGVIRLMETPKNLKIFNQEIFQLNGANRTVFALPNITEIHIDKVLAEENESYVLPTWTANKIKYKVLGGYTTYEDMEKSSFIVGKSNKRFLNIFGDIGNRIKAITENITRDASTDVDKIDSILYYFRQNFRYSLKTENINDLDPLENFFFVEKKGYCEVYATSLVIMLRSAKIPARVCIGYCGGEYVESINSYVFYSDEAHAWAEIYVQDYGWVVVDATPATYNRYKDVATDDKILQFEPKQFSEFGPNENKIKDSHLAKGLIGVLEYALISVAKDPVLLVNLILLTYPITFFMIFGVFKFFKRRKINSEDNIRQPSFVNELYKAFGKKPKGDTLHEYISKIKAEKISHQDLDEVLFYYYSVYYGKTQRNADIEAQLIIKINLIKELLNQKLI